MPSSSIVSFPLHWQCPTSEAGKSSRKPKPVSAFVGPDQTVPVSFRPGRGARGTHHKSERTAVFHFPGFPVFVLAGVGLSIGFIGKAIMILFVELFANLSLAM